VVHGVVDWIFAVPLFLIPDAFLRALGWTVVDPMAARGMAAALVGIGTQSLLARNSTGAVYRELLSLKIPWSFTATLGFAWTAPALGHGSGGCSSRSSHSSTSCGCIDGVASARALDSHSARRHRRSAHPAPGPGTATRWT
jgi:hypothetical protein